MRNVAEQATGCFQNGSGIGQIYDKHGAEITADEAVDLAAEEQVEVPNAGAGSYKQVFRLLGAKETERFESSSSAGDWTFLLRMDDGWRFAWQDNRYPYHGFRYSISPYSFVSKDDAVCYYESECQ